MPFPPNIPIRIPPREIKPLPFAFGIPTVINFDDVPNGTAVDTHYAGVTFASITTSPARQWSAYARGANGAQSAPNVVSVRAANGGFPAFDAADGGIQATFTAPKLFVSIEACPVIAPEHLGPVTNKPFIQSFDAQGNVLQTVDYPLNYGQANYGSWQTLTVSAPSAMIAKVIFSSHRGSGTHVYGLFDHMVFSDRRSIIPLGLL